MGEHGGEKEKCSLPPSLRVLPTAFTVESRLRKEEMQKLTLMKKNPLPLQAVTPAPATGQPTIQRCLDITNRAKAFLLARELIVMGRQFTVTFIEDPQGYRCNDAWRFTSTDPGKLPCQYGVWA